MNQRLIAGLLACMPSLALAHPGHELTTQTLSNPTLASAYLGFMHPLTGLDHLLVMLAIGLWAGKLASNAATNVGNKIRWQLPITFMGLMLVGAILGAQGFAFAGLETAIAASVMAMGLLLVISLPIKPALAIGMVAVFALLHGAAHGLETNGAELNFAQGWAVVGGMLLATGLLHALGLLLGSQRAQLAKWLNATLAYVMMLAGAYLLFA